MHIAIIIIGYAGNAFLGLQLVPQIFQSIRTGTSRDVSTPFIYTTIFGLVATGVYAVAIKEYPIILGVACGTLLNIVLLMVKYVHSRENYPLNIV